MAGRTPNRKGKATRKNPVTQSSRAGLIFSVARCTRRFREGRYAPSIGTGAGIFTAAVLEYLTCELLELAGEVALGKGRKIITPRFIQLAIASDEELSKVLALTTIPEAGIASNINKFLFPKKGDKKKNASATQEMWLKWSLKELQVGKEIQRKKVTEKRGLNSVTTRAPETKSNPLLLPKSTSLPEHFWLKTVPFNYLLPNKQILKS